MYLEINQQKQLQQHVSHHCNLSAYMIHTCSKASESVKQTAGLWRCWQIWPAKNHNIDSIRSSTSQFMIHCGSMPVSWVLDWITIQSVQVPPAPTLLDAILPRRRRVSERERLWQSASKPRRKQTKNVLIHSTPGGNSCKIRIIYVKLNKISNHVTVQRNSLRVLAFHIWWKLGPGTATHVHCGGFLQTKQR